MTSLRGIDMTTCGTLTTKTIAGQSIYGCAENLCWLEGSLPP